MDLDGETLKQRASVAEKRLTSRSPNSQLTFLSLHEAVLEKAAHITLYLGLLQALMSSSERDSGDR